MDYLMERTAHRGMHGVRPENEIFADFDFTADVRLWKCLILLSQSYRKNRKSLAFTTIGRKIGSINPVTHRRVQQFRWTSFYSAPQCSHCKCYTSYGNSVPPSVTRRYCVKTTTRSTVQFALSDSKMYVSSFVETKKIFPSDNLSLIHI